MNIHYIAPRGQTHDGYGMATKHLRKAFLKKGILLSHDFKNQKVSLIHSYPQAIDNAKGDIKIIYTMFESDKIPNEWVPYLRKADHVIVPSVFCQEVFKKEGIDSIVIPLGYDEDLFKVYKRPKRKIFTFIHYNAFDDRKGWRDLVDAWGRAFNDNDPVRLILKTTYPDKEMDAYSKYGVEVIRGKLPHSAVYEILKDADCFVFPSMGEGFSHNPLEAMATGLPVIITKAHAHLSYFDDRYMYGIKIRGKIPAEFPHFKEPVGEFTKASIDDLVDKLKYVFYNKDEAREKGLKAAKFVKNNFTYRHTVEKFIQLFRELNIFS